MRLDSAKSTLLMIAFIALCFQPSFLLAQEAKSAEANASDSMASENTIRSGIDSYIMAFNQGDAKALANHWSKEGSFSAASGATLNGRQQLEESFIAYFEKSRGAKIEILSTEISLISPNVATETGIAKVSIPNSEPSETQYEAIHVKTSEGWKIDSVIDRVIDTVREQAIAADPTQSNYEQLQSLEWMIGSWIDTDDQALVETNCRWTTNQNFIVKTFKVFIQDRIDFEGTQVIGWDAHAKAIRSWTFDSDGGFGVGHWSGGDASWTVRTLNVLPDGRRGSSTNTYNLLDNDTVQFKSIGRQVDGELLPSIDPITVTRLSN